MERIKMTLPANGCRVAPFFVLNADLQTDDLRRRVKECAQAGFDGIIIHPRAGLKTPYLSNAWFDAVQCCMEEAAEYGLQSWLYDEYPYPSGVAGGRVIRRNPEFAERHLTIRRRRLEGNRRVVQVLEEETLLQAFLVAINADGKPDWSTARTVTSSVGVRNSTWISSEWDSRHYYLPKYTDRYECRRSMEYLSEQVFEETLPGGTWELITFGLMVGSDFAEPFGHYVDVSNAEATKAFLEETHEAYQERFGKWFGGRIPGVFTDEPKYRNALPWSRPIAEAWEDYQKDPRALLGLLPDAADAGLRYRYRKLTSALFLNNWVKPISKWCRNRNLDLIGHISPEEDWWAESRSTGSILRNLREFGIPGCDLIIPATGDRGHPVLSFTPSLAVSAAAQSGATRALCEVFGCSDYSLDMQTMKRVSDWLLVSGINFITPHGCFYSLAGMRRFDAPPTFLPPSTLFPFLKRWSGEVREIGSRLGPSLPVEIALIRPVQYLFGLDQTEEARAMSLFDEALKTIQQLLERGMPFHWVDDEDLLEGIREDGTLQVGKCRYSTIVVREDLLPGELADVLEKGRASGLKVLSHADARELEGPLQCAEGDVRVAKDSEGTWFCVNLSSEPRQFRIEGVACELDGYESRWLEAEFSEEADTERLVLDANWEITPPPENVFRLTSWTCNGEPQVPGHAYARVMNPDERGIKTVFGRIPSNPGLNASVALVYEAEIDWAGPGVGVFTLCLEEGAVEGAWTAFCNDRPLGGWKSRDKDSFGGVGHEMELQPGSNRVRIEVQAGDARDGLWLAPVIRGNFVVAGANRLAAPKGELRGNDWSVLGYPHFSGSMEFEQDFEWTEGDDACLCLVRPPFGAVEVFLNDQPLGSLLWSPWRLPLNGALQAGTNRLRLRITNSLYNFIYGKSLPSGPGVGVEIQTKAPSWKTPSIPSAAKATMTA